MTVRAQGGLAVGEGSQEWYALSGDEHWCTPDEELDGVVRRFGAVGLDPCSNKGSRVGARVTCGLEDGDDGLAVSWRGHGLVYVNPPYGRGVIERWTRKAAREFGREHHGGDELLLLVPANTETLWYHRDILTAAVTCLRRGRIQFRRPDGSKGRSSSVANLYAYWGLRRELALDVLGRVGDARENPRSVPF